MSDTAVPPITAYEPEESLLRAFRAEGRPRLQLHRPDVTAVVLGRGSRPDTELHLDACVQDSLPLLRRRGGGCAVVLDPGTLIVAVALPAPGLRLERYFASLSQWLVDGLERAGVPGVTRQDVSDLCLGDRKIAGACMVRSKGLLYYSVSLLVDPDISLMTRYLKHPPREPAYRRGRPHAEFVTTLGRHAHITPEELARRLQHVLTVPSLGRPG